MKLVSKSPAQTKKIAAELAQRILGTEQHDRAVVIALEGELGAGKTVFVQGVARELGIRRAIKSPTFLIMREYPARDMTLYHIDCYRVNGPRDLVPLEFKHILAEPCAIVLIEWAERVRRLLPPHTIRVHIDHISDHERRIIITP